MQQETARRSNRERTETTRAGLVAAARRLFVEKGYAETSTPEIAAAAQVTRGALYHHFADKQALFRAVVEQEATAVAVEIEQAAPPDLPAQVALIRGGEAYLTAMSVPGRTRLLLLDGPAVLGRVAMDEIDRSNAAASLQEGVACAVSSGIFPQDVPVGALSDLLSAAFDRAALAIESGESAGPYRRAITAVIEALAKAG